MWNIIVKKLLKRGIQAALAALVATGIPEGWGLLVNPESGEVTLQAYAASFALLELVRGWLKHKVGLKFL